MNERSSLLSLPDARSSAPRWHISPLVDLCAYAFSWVWILLPLAFSGNERADYLVLWILILTVTDVHRHYGLPLVYLDREVRSRFRLRFTLFPLVMLALFGAAPFFRRFAEPLSLPWLLVIVAGVVLLVQTMRLDRDGHPPTPAIAWAWGTGGGLVLASLVFDVRPLGWVTLGCVLIASTLVDVLRPAEGHPARKPKAIAPAVILALLMGSMIAMRIWPSLASLEVKPKAILDFTAVVAGAWNIWHVYMQKYGILRMYNAKSGNPSKVPGWVDRGLIFGWLPFYFIWLGTTARDVLMTSFGRGRATLTPIVDAMEVLKPWLLVPTVAVIVFTVGTFAFYEWRINRFQNAPRLLMALGTTLLSSTFLFLHPLKAYLAYAFSHGIEYMVFVWAYQRRRYADPLPHDPLLGRLLRRPLLAYAVFTLGLGALFIVLKYWGRSIFPDALQPHFIGLPTWEWIRYWTIFQSMLHFYFDGFLWKMRAPTTTAHL